MVSAVFFSLVAGDLLVSRLELWVHWLSPDKIYLHIYTPHFVFLSLDKALCRQQSVPVVRERSPFRPTLRYAG